MVTGRWGRVWPLQRSLLRVSLVLAVSGLAIMWVNGALRPYIEKDFLYSADITSAENIYDAQNQRYMGDRYSKGMVSYQLKGLSDGVARIYADFRLVKASDSTPTLHVDRDRSVAARNGRFIPSANDTSSDQYLFAPRNLRPGQSYAYRHIMYDAPASMRYQGRSDLHGLEVYKYKAVYASNVLLNERYVQPQALPADEAIAIQPGLEVWVEPVTGWLVKFEDTGKLVRYNRLSGQKLQDVSRFHTEYTDESVRQQVAYVRSLKYRQTFAGQTIPATVGSIVIVAFLVLTMRRVRGERTVRAIALAIMLISGIALAGWACNVRPFMAVFIGHAVVHPLSALCFIFVANCLLLMHLKVWRGLCVAMAAVIAGLGVVGLLGSTHLTPSVLDLANHQTTVQAIDLHQSSRMSAFSASLFVLLGASILKLALSGRALSFRFATFGFGAVATLGVAGLLMQLLRLDQPLSLSFVNPLSAATLVSFVLSGYAFVVVAQERHGMTFGLGITVRRLLQPALLCVPLLVIGFLAQLRQNVVQNELQTSFLADTAVIQRELTKRVTLYNNAVTAVRTSYASLPRLEPAAWHSLTASYNIGQRFPGIYSIGFAKSLTSGQADAFVALQKQQGLANYAIFPAASRDTVTPVTYIEPQTAAVQKELGHDLSADDARSAAMQQARDENITAITGRIDLSPASTSADPGLMAVLPVYVGGQPIQTVSERRAAIDGYIFAAIDVNNFVGNLPAVRSHRLDFRIYDGVRNDTAHLLYDSRVGRGAPAYVPRLTTSTTGYVFGRPIAVEYDARPDFRLKGQDERIPGLLLVAGATGYLLLLAGTFVAMQYRGQLVAAGRRLTRAKGRAHEK